MFGPPGTGKTCLARAVAQILKSTGSHNSSRKSLPLGGTFVSLGISDIVSAEVGTSEKLIASSFEFARQNSPSVIFLDEFQALFTDRNRGGSGRLTTTLLQCLDDIKRWYGSNVDTQIAEDASSTEGSRIVVIAATNTPWMIDSAFLRPGRFDRVVHVGLPTAAEREAILLIHVGRMQIRGKEKSDTVNVICRYISSRTEGFSGADLAALCRAAAVRALLEDPETNEVRESHFKEALNHDVCPSSDEALVQRLAQWRP